MKYNININQSILSKTNLDLVEGAILDYVYFYCNSLNKKIDSQRIKDEFGTWTWINYQTLLKDMPLLRIKSSGALTPRIKSIEDAGYIETRREGNQKLFIRLTDKTDELFIETNRAIHQNKQLHEESCSRTRTNNNTIDNNTSDKELAALAPPDSLNEIIELFKPVNPSYARIYPNKNQRVSLERLLKQHGDEKLRKIIGWLPKSNAMEFAPTITTPIELENKLGKLIAFIQKQGNKESKVIKL